MTPTSATKQTFLRTGCIVLAAAFIFLTVSLVQLAQTREELAVAKESAEFTYANSLSAVWGDVDASRRVDRAEESVDDATKDVDAGVTRRNWALGSVGLAALVLMIGLVIPTAPPRESQAPTGLPSVPGPGPASGESSAAKRLQEARELHVSGLLSDDEYRLLRQRILDEL